MCGISGILKFADGNIDLSLLEKMTQAVSHRGPDGYGFVAVNSRTGKSIITHNQPLKANTISEDYNIGLGHRRLAIIDLSETGNQPMHRNNLFLTFNGEIYNYIELREELKQKGHIFSSSSDTEVILHAYQEWDISCLDKFAGMFAFALWDQGKGRLFCARDRFGIKPFYYYHNSNQLLFASEIKQFFYEPSIKQKPNDAMAYDYLVHGFLDHTGQTLFKDIYQLEPGSYLIATAQGEVDIQSYWSLNTDKTLKISETASAEIFYDLLSRSVREHLRSDTTVGACLSGGLDSTAITCLANYILKENNATAKQATFSSVFTDSHCDEREYSNAVIDFLGIANKTVFPQMSNVLEDIRTIMDFHDEPFGSTSQYAQWKLYDHIQEAGIKVVLNGQGADEILAGYHSCYGAFHLQLLKEFNWISLAQEIKSCKEHHNYKNRGIANLAGSALAIYLLGPRLSFLRPAPHWLNKDFYQMAEGELSRPAPHHSDNLLSDFLLHLLQFNLRGLLRYEDRNSMAHSVESRLPFLDHRLVEFLFSIPRDQIISKGWTKSILRKSMKDRMPERVRLRKDKMGFVTPEQKWISSLSPKTIDEIINTRTAKESGYFDIENTRKEICDITQGRIPFNFLPWRILNFCVWLEKSNQILTRSG
jgi:asparagine synthase (glutamine-hydrolysing)